jgi:hypothetical protein
MASNETTVGFEVLALPPVYVQVTIQEFATAHKCEYVEAAGTIRFLRHKGIAKKVGKRYAPFGGRGKPTDVYQIPTEINLKLSA